MAEGAWSDAENSTIVSDYFAMLRMEIADEKYSKAEHNRRLQLKLPARNRGAIEYKHQNISAVMLGLGQPWITGYKPASQFQLSLIDAVLNQLAREADWLAAGILEKEGPAKFVRDPASLWIGAAPTFSNEPPPIDLESAAVISRRYNVAARDEANRKLGDAGEEYILEYERSYLQRSGRSDLAAKVVWTSKEEGDGAGYDIASFEPNGNEKLLEVKTTNGWDRTPFHITRNELAVADRNRETWQLIRLWNFVREPKAFAIRPPLEAHLSLTPSSFLASLQ